MPRMKKTLIVAIVCMLGLFVVVWAGCKGQATQTANSSSRSVSEAESPAKPAKKKVANIVFIGQKQACDCTRNRIKASWEALQAANASSLKVPVERIDWDVQEKAAERYINMKSLMVTPGIYFLDTKGALVEMLQGEVKKDTISKLLN